VLQAASSGWVSTSLSRASQSQDTAARYRILICSALAPPPIKFTDALAAGAQSPGNLSWIAAIVAVVLLAAGVTW